MENLQEREKLVEEYKEKSLVDIIKGEHPDADLKVVLRMLLELGSITVSEYRYQLQLLKNGSEEINIK
jgi:hypothetical protein